jgi:hypothetical protein
MFDLHQNLNEFSSPFFYFCTFPLQLARLSNTTTRTFVFFCFMFCSARLNYNFTLILSLLISISISLPKVLALSTNSYFISLLSDLNSHRRKKVGNYRTWKVLNSNQLNYKNNLHFLNENNKSETEIIPFAKFLNSFQFQIENF